MKLNLCCGPNMFPGWINVDRFDQSDYLRHLREAPAGFVWLEPQRALAAHIKAGEPFDFEQADVRQGLRCADGSVELIYIGQAIEHFNRRTEAPALLRECARVLKPGGAIKLTTPDLCQLVDAFWHGRMNSFAHEQPEFFRDALAEDKLSYLLFGASGADCTAETYEGHFHCYTFQSLHALLQECGLEPYGKDRVRHDGFHECADMGMTHSFAIEARKP